MNGFPLMLYRAGSALQWDGRGLDVLVVDDATALATARAGGWLTVADLMAPKPAAAAPRARKAA